MPNDVNKWISNFEEFEALVEDLDLEFIDVTFDAG